MKVVVTGVRGFIGTAVASVLVEAGHEVVGIDRSPKGRDLPSSVTSVVGDVLVPEQWSDALEGADALIHGAAVHQVDAVTARPIRAIEANVLGTLRVLETAVSKGVQRVVFLSSAKVYGEPERLPSRETDLPTPIEPYGLAKVVCESYCDHFRGTTGLEVTAIRPFSVYGPGQDLDTGYIGAFLGVGPNAKQLALPGASTFVRDFVFIDDVVAACEVAATRPDPPEDVVNVGSGEPWQLDDLGRLVSEIQGVDLGVTYEPPRAGTITRSAADIDRMVDLIGRQPTSLLEGLAATFQWARRVGVDT